MSKNLYSGHDFMGITHGIRKVFILITFTVAAEELVQHLPAKSSVFSCESSTLSPATRFIKILKINQSH